MAADVAQRFSQYMGNVVGERVADFGLLPDFNVDLEVIKLGKAGHINPEHSDPSVSRAGRACPRAL